MNNYPRLVIAGVKGGSGKTTLSLGLIAALKSRGLKVIPFKKGPDYIDAGWLSAAAKNPCFNLDPFFLTREKIMESFAAHFTGDITVIEGNRGLYDGMDAEGSYSTAELAKFLHSPVILIVDCTKMTRTAAAVVLGCMNLDRDVDIKGVVLNQVSGSRHESVVRQSIEKYCSLPVLGAIPRLKSGEMPERHMGLTPYQEHPDTSNVLTIVEDIARKYLDLDAILGIANSAEPPNINSLSPMAHSLSPVVKIGVIRDSAFQFYYPENLEELERGGAELVEINAVEGERLPDIDGLYIGGGFPETNAIKLAENAGFRESVRESVERGLPVYAECGGLMFLGDSITVKGESYPMVGIFPLVFEMMERPQAHGYTIVEVKEDNPFYPAGTVLHGHEFHYSALVEDREKDGIYMAFGMKRGQGIKDKADGICYKNTLATYTHIHALGSPEWAAGFIKKAKEFKDKNE
ncbi:MAG TPA: cobyrinic acid a,c-diamide synthase [Nitrospiraceae bacterium]|nr:MAG: cobyrinic acid a,c-diamide synthase [Nitrospirae bacterium GWA2_46_11]OGW26049.1 MAG: cobyrinic acid a,c-diamide synthase [Nitrospirae bacterium GWB2_47_37]HAK87523.1 cobyrinic acid a,c-diamide synthase [Nitrospiraceae bacterium]HCL81104.1 cobyrinic acid a,c-diamide synthase [Nitrospiraceae bacterium]HCZ11548.1 cobyrinic acid a,c-diamide synthase [Nitrospiraceae bacterium]